MTRSSVEVLEANPHNLADDELKASLRNPLITEVIFWSSRGNLDMVKEIVGKCNLDVSEEDFADYDKRTPLHLAAAEGCYRVCQWLISQNVNINSVDRFNQTPLGSALLGGHTQVIQLFMKNDGKVLEGEQLIPITESDNAAAAMLKAGLQEHLTSDHWDIYENEISMLKPHGSGAFGTVYMASWRGTVIAAKCLKVDVRRDPDALLEFKTELGLLQRLHHPHVVQFLGACTKSIKPILVTEFMSGGSLDMIFRQTPKIGLQKAVRYSVDISKGLAYLHGRHPQPVIHRDLKPANIMISGFDQCKIGDFGLSRTLQPLHDKLRPGMKYLGEMSEAYVLTGETGSYRYMAPEVFRHETYNIKADCYAMAMIMYQMFEGKQPFQGMDPIKAAMMAASAGLRPVFSGSITPEPMKTLICDLWHPNPSKRPHFMEVLTRLQEFNTLEFEGKVKTGRKSGEVSFKGGDANRTLSVEKAPPQSPKAEPQTPKGCACVIS
mmetsp:Transcript_964/g.1701  ORF Transcript_964/g.1701 Transcript_964/m.1701 type:complete len:493 (+) Transcript_964:198-1676(+)